MLIAIPLSPSVSREAIAPTIVISRPSRIQTVPSPMTTIQWKRAHGRRSMRGDVGFDGAGLDVAHQVRIHIREREPVHH